MIVEFVGSSAAGKTTLASEVRRRLAGRVRVVTSYELTAGLVGLGQVEHPTIRNLVQDLLALPFFAVSVVRHRAFLAYALRTVAGRAGSPLLAANYVRSLVRRIGGYEIARRYGRDRIVLADEGTVLSAHLLFVFAQDEPGREKIETFAGLVPLPDLVVCVRAPLDNLVRRSLQRSDAPRELRAEDEQAIEKYLRRARGLFDRLAETKQLRDRVLVVANPTPSAGEGRMVAEQIAAFILNYEPNRGQVATRPAGRIESVAAIGEKGAS
jgi:thymidylate kinase